MGRRVDSDQNDPSIFLIFKLVIKEDVLIPNIVSKSVYGHYIKSYGQFNFENLKFEGQFTGRKTAKIIKITKDF